MNSHDTAAQSCPRPAPLVTWQRAATPSSQFELPTTRWARVTRWVLMLAWAWGLNALGFALVERSALAADEPPLPATNGVYQIPAQPWPLRPGPRSVRVRVCYPTGRLDGVTPKTGLFLTLHNWGGSDSVGTAQPEELARRCDCVALCVDYLQSGPKDSIEGPEPYDFGWLQALDALRALQHTFAGLTAAGIEFDRGRIFATGGSGGGNVALMAHKLAPHTFTAVIDLCGMPKLSDDIAFNRPGGSGLNARYSRDPASSAFLSRDAQEIRFIGHPGHAALQKQWGSTARLYIVHGADDDVCPIEDAREMIANLQGAGLDVVPRIVQAADVDGKVFASTGHSLGDRTGIVFRVAGEVLEAGSPSRLRRTTPTDFERPQHAVRYRTSRGEWVISYRDGPPVGEFVPDPPPPDYPDHRELLYWLEPPRPEAGDAGTGRAPIRHVVSTPADWLRRRAHIQRHFERVAGEFPGPAVRVAPRFEVLEETRAEGLWRRKVRYQTALDEWVSAWLLAPDTPNLPPRPRPGILCLQQTTEAGKDEPVGLAGDRELAYARELALRGFVTLSPDYPSFGEHAWDFAAHPEYASGTMKAIWDNVVAVDVLQAIPGVARDRIGCIGHSLGGHNAIFTALFEPRLRAVVSSCGFTALGVDDLPSWTGPRYMPRIASEFRNDIQQLPFDFHELIGAIAPRACFISAATRDSDFAVAGVKEVVDAARKVYAVHNAESALRAIYPEAEHSFPRAARDEAYRFLEEALGRPGE